MLVQFQRQLELGANAVRSRDQHRLPVAIQRQFKQGAKTAQPAQHTRPEGAFGVRLDAIHQPVTGINVYPGVAVTKSGGLWGMVVHHSSCLRAAISVLLGRSSVTMVFRVSAGIVLSPIGFT